MNSLNTKKWNSEDWIKNYMPYTKVSLSRKIQMGEKPNDIKQKIVGDIKTNFKKKSKSSFGDCNDLLQLLMEWGTKGTHPKEEHRRQEQT